MITNEEDAMRLNPALGARIWDRRAKEALIQANEHDRLSKEFHALAVEYTQKSDEFLSLKREAA